MYVKMSEYGWGKSVVRGGSQLGAVSLT